MDVRLIDANALMKRICGHECGMHPEDCDGMESETVPCNFHAYVSDAPTIDAIPREKWNELKETIIEMRDNGCTASTMDVCKFLTNLMEILEKEGKNDGFD